MWWRLITHSMHWEWTHYPQWTSSWPIGTGGGLGHQDFFSFFLFLSLRGKKKIGKPCPFLNYCSLFSKKKKKRRRTIERVVAADHRQHALGVDALPPVDLVVAHWHWGWSWPPRYIYIYIYFFVLIYFSFLSLRGKKKWKTLSSFSTIALSFLQKKKKLLLSHFFRGIVIHMCKGLVVSMEITIYRNKPLQPYQTKE
jgi:hypothetical protein